MFAIANPVPSDRAPGNLTISGRQSKDISPRTMGRLSAAFLLATIVGGVFASAFLVDGFVVSGDAAATARNIVANQSAVRAAFAIFMIEMACQIVTTAVTCELLMPVDRSLARTAAAFGYVGCAIKIFARLFLYAPLYVLGSSPYLSAFTHNQLEVISFLLIRIDSLGAGTACIFLGLSTMTIGYLMLRATFLPRLLGVCGIIGGAGWLSYLYPPLASAVFLPVALTALFGCAVTIGWLLIRGVDEKKWHEMAGLSASSIWR